MKIFFIISGPSPKVIKLFSYSAQMRLKFILLINVKLPTTVGILTFISKINYRLMGFMPEFSTDLGYFSINSCSAELSMKKIYIITSGPGLEYQSTEQISRIS